ncbi:MAG TPA: hypothetical protein VFC39_15430 [Acidobacteriaceae bacterium]|nr:hypothetical protein [Acidobacteriaceae bacterium]
MLISIRWWCALCALLAVAPCRAQVTPIAFDWKAFNSLTQAEKFQVVLTILDARDAALQNVEYTVFEDAVNVRKSDGGRRKMHHSIQEFRRIGATKWMHILDYHADDDDNSNPRDESEENWDGKTARRLRFPPYSGKNAPMGEIDPKPYVCFYQHRFAAVMGSDVQIMLRAMSVAEWLRDAAVNLKSKIAVSAAERDGISAIVVSVNADPYHRELWLDPARGFLILYYNMYVNDQKIMENTVETKVARQVSGVWVPILALGRGTGRDSAETTEVTYAAKDFKIGAVRQQDVEVVFPTGANVLDEIQRISYTNLGDGKYKLMPLAESSARVVHTPPEGKITTDVGPSAAKLYTTTSMATYVRNAQVSRRSVAIRTAIIVGSALVAVFWIILYRRKNRHLTKSER